MSFLDDIPDMQGLAFDQIAAWVNSRIEAIETTYFTPEIIHSFAPVELTQAPEHPYGPEASLAWRRFFLATLLADWACYDKPVDRIDVPRLKYILSSAHPYFRLWCCRLADGLMTPVGYSACYPISRFVYNGLLDNADEITDRGAFLPLRFARPEDVRYGYVLNVSIVKPLRNTFCGTRLVRTLQRDGQRFKHVNAVTVTVDEAGNRLSRMSHFTQLGNVTIQGHAEGLFVRETVEG